MKNKKIKTKIPKSLKPFFHRKNLVSLQMVVFIGLVSLSLAFVAASFIRFQNAKVIKENRSNAYTDEIKKLAGISSNLVPTPDITEEWNAYENQQYSFSVRYPSNWQTAREIPREPASKYLLKVSFDEKGFMSEESQKGFDVFIYDSAKYPDATETNTLIRKGQVIRPEDCLQFDSITLGEKEYPAKEVFVKADDPCYEETFFYSLTQNGYTYNMVPRDGKNSNVFSTDAKRTLVRTFPEFYDIVSTLNLDKKETGIAQTSKVIIKRVISSPPVRFVSGPSCAEKNDHPSNSKTKGKHMDEDCCPDPDEWPNPHCSYSAHALGVMRSKPKK